MSLQNAVAVSCWLIHIMFSFVLFAFPEVYQRGPLGSTQTQTWDDAEIRTSQDWFGHYCRYSRPCETDVHLHCVFKCPHAAFRWTIFTLTSACSNTRYHMGFYIQCKCELTVVLLLWIVISAHYIFLDQTPTPTRFLKNCEEVGLFNELASSFEQDDDEKRAKNSVSNTCGWWFYLLLSLRLCMTVCITVYSNRRNFLQRLDMTRKNYILLPSFLSQVLIQSKKFTNLNFVPCTQSVCHLHFSFCSNFFLNCLVFYCTLYAFQSWGCGCLVCDECPLPFFFSFFNILWSICSVRLFSLSVTHFQLPASNSVALDMSLQTPSEVKVKQEAPVEVDSSPPDSPDSTSGKSDSNREPLVKGKVQENLIRGIA